MLMDGHMRILPSLDRGNPPRDERVVRLFLTGPWSSPRALEAANGSIRSSEGENLVCGGYYSMCVAVDAVGGSGVEIVQVIVVR